VKDIDYTVEDYRDIRVVTLSGNISNATKSELMALVRRIAQSASVVINMTNVPMVTSSGLDALVEMCNAARSMDRRVLLMNVHDDIVKMIETLDLYDYFIFVESIEEGRRKLSYYV